MRHITEPTRWDWRGAVIFIGGPLLLLALLAVELTLGQAQITVSTVLDAFLAPSGSLEHEIVRTIRMPRAVLGLLAGGALAVAGVLLQTLTKNPMASASTLGINAGAFFAVIASAVFLPGLVRMFPLGVAFTGGLAAAICAYMLAGGARSTPVRMALGGMSVALVLSALTGALQLLFETETGSLFLWGSGSLVQTDWQGVSYSLPWIIAGTLAALLMSRTLDVMLLDEEVSHSLGQRIGVVRFVGLATAVLLAAATVSVAGPIGFVGLSAPHLMRLIGLRRHRSLLPASFIWGAVVLVAADIVVLLLETKAGQLPVGSITALIGAPWLIWLVFRVSRERGGGTGSQMASNEGRAKPPYALVLGSAGIVLAAAFTAGLLMGGEPIPFTDFGKLLIGQGDSLVRFIILELRLPRLLVAALAGAALAISGLLLQGVVRNPLADPSLVGITSGAGLGALLMLIVWPALPVSLLPIAAFAGAVAAALLVFVFAGRGGLQPASLVLVGIAISAMGSAGIQVLVVRAQMQAALAISWLVGSTYARGWSELAWLFLWPLVLIPVAWYLARKLDLLALGDSSATGLGLHTEKTRLAALIVAVALAAAAVATVGTVGFVGLLAPHAARLLVGHRHRRLVPLAMLLGAAFMTLADFTGRIILPPKEIPSGIVVALLGAPYFLWLMRPSKPKLK